MPHHLPRPRLVHIMPSSFFFSLLKHFLSFYCAVDRIFVPEGVAEDQDILQA